MQKMTNRNGCFFDFVLKRHPPNFKCIYGGNMELDIFNKLNESELIKIQQWVALQNDFGNQINKLKGKDNLKKRKKLKEEFDCKCVEFLDELPSKFINSEVF